MGPRFYPDPIYTYVYIYIYVYTPLVGSKLRKLFSDDLSLSFLHFRGSCFVSEGLDVFSRDVQGR